MWYGKHSFHISKGGGGENAHRDDMNKRLTNYSQQKERIPLKILFFLTEGVYIYHIVGYSYNILE